ncbi:hypothetical protein [Deinococcus multiflagellatus]|uniref:DNA-directed RNA polymerase n=1 Tax=Deinococcus multiflagellatus TaxID=1656887 RepID=A0ABW1ZTM5_9DEIO
MDFSGRAVITPDPSLTLDQVALPEAMARTLFAPHLIAALRREGVPFRVTRAVLADPRPLDADTRATLETLMAAATVLVNRAPTLHRPSLLAFTPVLSPGLTLGLHPLACEGMNADFDGDTVAVHLVLGTAAQREARERLTLRANLRSPATGQLAVKPSKDMVLGLYQLTQAAASSRTPLPAFCGPDEAALAVATGVADWTDDCLVMLGGERVRATPGQAQVWQTVTALTGDAGLYRPQPLTKGAVTTLISQALARCGPDTAAQLLDALKTVGLTHATVAGLSIGISDVLELPERSEWLALGQAQVQALDAQVAAGLLTSPERDRAALQTWTELKEALGAETVAWFEASAHNPLTVLLTSGARGSSAQLTQLAAMRGLMARPDGTTVLHPVLSSFRRGLSPLEYFLSSHGARKGAADTALRTAHAGYLTRRLVLTLQHWRVAPGDCGDTTGVAEEPPSPGRIRLPGGRVRSP